MSLPLSLSLVVSGVKEHVAFHPTYLHVSTVRMKSGFFHTLFTYVSYENISYCVKLFIEGEGMKMPKNSQGHVPVRAEDILR